MHSHFEIMIEEIFWVGRRYDIMLNAYDQSSPSQSNRSDSLLEVSHEDHRVSIGDRYSSGRYWSDGTIG
jgi:hypothetical protein